MSIGELEVPTAVVIGISAVPALALVWWVVATYNRLIKQRNQVRSSWAQIDVQLKRRYDLIPNLVATAAASGRRPGWYPGSWCTDASWATSYGSGCGRGAAE